MALGLSSQPGSVVQAGSLRRAPQRVARLAAEAHSAAHGELLPQADAVHRHAGVSAQAGGVACERQSGSVQLENVNPQNSKMCPSLDRFGAVGNHLTGRFTISQNKLQIPKLLLSLRFSCEVLVNMRSAAHVCESRSNLHKKKVVFTAC